MKVNLEVPIVKNLMTKNVSSLQPTPIWLVERHSVKLALKTLLKNIGKETTWVAAKTLLT